MDKGLEKGDIFLHKEFCKITDIINKSPLNSL